MQTEDKVVINDGGLVAIGTVTGEGWGAPMQTDFAAAANAAGQLACWARGTMGCCVKPDLEPDLF